MRRGVIVGGNAVHASGNNLAVLDNDGAEGTAAVINVLYRQVDCHLHEVGVFGGIVVFFIVCHISYYLGKWGDEYQGPN